MLVITDFGQISNIKCDAESLHDVKSFSNDVDKMDRDQAMDFLTSDSFHLRMICELAGRDASYVRRKIRKKLLNE